MNSNTIKIADTKYPVLDVIKNRWSARSFSDEPIDEKDLYTLVEAASWMFSANNEQPWRFIVAPRGTIAFSQVMQSLVPGNLLWAKNAAAFIVSITKTVLEKEWHPANNWAEHDLGAANAAMILQATSMGLYAHPMAGFNAASLKESFRLSEYLKPLTVIAFGYLDDAEKLEEPFKSRELTPRKRKPLAEIILNHSN